MDRIQLNAPAKINLGLDIVRRREDGYHDVRMIMQTIGLHDTLTVTRKAHPGIALSTNRGDLPVDGNNLICRAGNLLMEEFSVTDGLDVTLTKRIPVAAGMAGGSTDAAAMMIAVNTIFDLGLTRQQLMERAVKIGADVPYCILQGTALAEGIGEKLTVLPAFNGCPVLIAKPDIAVSTAFVYRNLKLGADTVHPAIDAQIDAIGRKDLAGVCDAMGNLLATVTVPAFPVIEQIRQQMLASGARGAMMSGSGPTVFGLFAEQETAQKAEADMKTAGLAKDVILTETIPGFCYS